MQLTWKLWIECLLVMVLPANSGCSVLHVNMQSLLSVYMYVICQCSSSC